MTGADTDVQTATTPTIAADALAARLSDDDLAVLDLGESRVFRKGHVPGAQWAIRSRIAATGPALPDTGTLVLTSDDGRCAALAVEEAETLTNAEVLVLAGGTNAWVAAGQKTEADPTYPADEACIDVYLRAYDRNTDVEARMQEYIDWEVALIDQVAADDDVQFKMGPSA